MDRLRPWEYVGDHGERDAWALGFEVENETLFCGLLVKIVSRVSVDGVKGKAGIGLKLTPYMVGMGTHREGLGVSISVMTDN